MFKTIPWPGERGYETWPPDAWKYIGAANVWTGFAVDKERGIVFCPTGSAAFDFWGGNRLGQNLYANCLLALDAKTGRRLWHFQFVHHDLWDRDLPAPPNLVTIHRNGKSIAAVAQVTKAGFIYVFNRETGEPIFPIEEKAVPASDLQGESAWPTQTHPHQTQTVHARDFSPPIKSPTSRPNRIASFSNASPKFARTLYPCPPAKKAPSSSPVSTAARNGAARPSIQIAASST